MNAKTEKEILEEKIEVLQSIKSVYTPSYITVNLHTVELLHSLFTGQKEHYPKSFITRPPEYGEFRIMGIPLSITRDDKSNGIYFEVRI